MTVPQDLYDLDVGSARLFLAVAELGSVSKAARRCGLAQPSATARLSKLERQLGVQLLERGPTGSEVTAAGRQLLAQCSALVAAAESLGLDAQSLTAAQTEVVTVAATTHIARHYLVDWVASAGLDDAEIRLAERPTATVAARVRSGEAMLGLVAGPHPPLGLRSESVGVEHLVAAVHPGHAWAARRRRVTAAELASARLILRSSGSGTRDVVQDALAQQDLVVDGPVLEVESDLAARLAAINGDGIAIVPARELALDLQAGRLVALSLRGLTLQQPLRIVWKGNRPTSAIARRLLAHIIAAPGVAGLAPLVFAS